MFTTAYIASGRGVQSGDGRKCSWAREASAPHAALAPDGLLIVIESDPARAAELRATYSSGAPGSRCTVIGGDPRRILYKLAGPFDVIFCAAQHLAVRPMLQQLLSPNGVLITNGDT
jgi:predicted O-methyltransferase YrrM